MSAPLALPPSITLKGSNTASLPLRMCDQHKRLAVPEGGVQMNPNKWVCASCWVRFTNRK